MFNANIPFYGIMILLALLVNIIIVMHIYKKFNFSKDEVIGAIIYENLGIIIGSKLLAFIESYHRYKKFEFLSLGLSSYGAVIGALVCLIVFGFQFKKSAKEILFLFTPSIPLMYAIGKIGCFLMGCCYGIEYDGLGSIVYHYSTVAPNYIHLFPIQIVESIIFLFIFIYMLIKTLKNKFTWKILGKSFILCGVAKYCLDYLRMSHVNIVLSLNQIISIVFIIIGIVMCYNKTKNVRVRYDG